MPTDKCGLNDLKMFMTVPGTRDVIAQLRRRLLRRQVRRGGVYRSSLSAQVVPLDSMLKLAYSTVEHDSHFDEAATFRRGFAGGAARTAGRGQGRDWVCVGARPEGQNAGEREATERYCTRRAGDCFRLQGRYVQGRLYRAVPKGRLRFACFPEEVQTGHCDAEA